MSEKLLSAIPDAEIDPDGVFKYVLIRVHSTAKGEDTPSKDIVRGYAWAEYHADIYDKVAAELEKGVPWTASASEAAGSTTTASRRRSTCTDTPWGFGRANHSVSTEKLKSRYPDYEISWADEGY